MVSLNLARNALSLWRIFDDELMDASMSLWATGMYPYRQNGSYGTSAYGSWSCRSLLHQISPPAALSLKRQNSRSPLFTCHQMSFPIICPIFFYFYVWRPNDSLAITLPRMHPSSLFGQPIVTLLSPYCHHQTFSLPIFCLALLVSFVLFAHHSIALRHTPHHFHISFTPSTLVLVVYFRCAIKPNSTRLSLVASDSSFFIS